MRSGLPIVMSCTWREAHLQPELMKLSLLIIRMMDWAGKPFPGQGSDGSAHVSCVYANQDLTCMHKAVWVESLGPRTHRRHSHTQGHELHCCTNQRWQRHHTRLQTTRQKLKSCAGNQKHLHQHTVLSKGWKHGSNTWVRACEEERWPVIEKLILSVTEPQGLRSELPSSLLLPLTLSKHTAHHHGAHWCISQGTWEHFYFWSPNAVSNCKTCWPCQQVTVLKFS